MRKALALTFAMATFAAGSAVACEWNRSASADTGSMVVASADTKSGAQTPVMVPVPTR
jgi:hypothetical protein